MKSTSTDAVILHARETGEGDIIVRAYTEEFGLIHGIFKGLKKSNRRSPACAETGACIHCVIPRIHNDKISIIQEAQVISPHTGIRDSLRKIVHLNFLSELILKSSPPHSRDTFVFRMLQAALDTLEISDKEYHLASFFTLHLLRTQGILPSLEKCSSCGSSVAADYHLSVSEKALLCQVCARIPRSAYLKIGNRERLFAISALGRKWSACDLSMITENEASSLLFALLIYMEHYYHTEFHTKTFLFSDELLNSEKELM